MERSPTPGPSRSRALAYRLFCHRRTLLVSVALVVAGALASVALMPPISLFGAPAALAALALVWLVLMAGLVLRYPGGWLDALTLSLTAALFLVPTPYLQLLLDDSGKGDRHEPIFALLLLFGPLAFILAWCGVTWAVTALGTGIHMGERKAAGSGFLPLPPEDARAALALRPDATVGRSVCGSVGWDGYFPVTFTAILPDPETFEPVETEMSYRARVLSSDESAHTLETVAMLDGRETRSIHRERFEPAPGGTVYSFEEQHTHFNLLAALGYWFQDYGADYMRAQIDDALGRETPANCRLPQTTALAALARLFTPKRPNRAAP